MRARNVTYTTPLFALLIAAPMAAQAPDEVAGARVLDAAAMNAALAEHESSSDQARSELSDLLSRSDVRELALDRGIDIERVESVASGLSDEQVRALAPLMEKVTPMVPGGMGSITVSVAAVVIILLILILVT